AKNFFPHISDMSFVAMSDDMSEIDDMIRNTPSWGKTLIVEYQDLADLNIPDINIGPYGMDGHKRLYRMEMTCSLEMVPNLMNIPVINIGPYGMDGHMRLERMEMTYSLELVTNLTNLVLNQVIEAE